MANEIFISYRRTDEPRARLLYNLLKERGVEAWYDAKIAAGEDWRTTTANALDAAPIFVLLMSRTASESGDIAKELAAATHKRKLVVPVRLDDMQLEGMFLYELASRNWTDAFQDPEAQLADLADKLADLVKAELSPEAVEELEDNVAHIAAEKEEAAKAKRAGLALRSGSVALITAVVAAVVVAVGAGVSYFHITPWSNPAVASTTSDGAASASADGTAKQTVDLAASLKSLADTAKAAGRSDADVANLTDAATKVADLTNKAAEGGDAAALSALATEMNNTALDAARKEIAAIAAEPVVSATRNDFKVAEAEQKASGGTMNADLAQSLEDANNAQDAIKAAGETAGGADPAAALGAAKSAQDALAVLVSLQSTASDAYLKGKRLAYASNSSAARSYAGQIAQVLASAKKPNVFSSSERKEAYKFLVQTDEWARERMAQVDVVASSVANADRKAAAKYASMAAAAKREIEAALANCRISAAKLN